MRKYNILISFIILIAQLTTYSQTDTLQFQFGNNQNFNEGNVSSDFGPRTSDFHNGVDFGTMSHGVSVCPFGTPILSLVDGTVVDITTFKQMKIRGTNAGYNFSYMHIFDNQTPIYINTGVQIGNFVLFRVTNSSLASINLATRQAIGIDNGTTITYNGQNYTISNQVTAGQGIAPIGNSGASVTHVHLYRLLNANGSTYANMNNTGNALQLLNYTKPTYNTAFYLFTNITRSGNTHFYSGSAQASIPVSVGMPNAQIDPTTNTLDHVKYLNVIKDVEKVELLIKKTSNPVDSFSLIKGPAYDSKIEYGGKITNTQNQWTITHCYPANIVSNPSGSATTTGVHPYAYYQPDSTNEVFYFSDIYTRIHKNHVQGTAAQFATINSDARYPDGEYNIYAKVTTIRDSIYPRPNNIRPDTILIDNFRPYIEKVEINREGETDKIYSRGWAWNGSALVFGAAPECRLLSKSKKLIVHVFTSEPMQNVRLKILSTTVNINSTQPADVSRKEWVFTVDPVTLTASNYTLLITGSDLAGNPVEGFRTAGNVTAFPVRQDNVTWSPVTLAKADSVHFFQVSNTNTVAAYWVSAIKAGFPLEMSFVNQTTGYYNSLIWSFGDGTTSSENNPVHSYATTGIQDFKLSALYCKDTAVIEKKALLLLLPFLKKVEIINATDTSNKVVFNRTFVNGKFAFSSVESPVDSGRSLIVRVTASGPVKNLLLTINDENKKTLFQSNNQSPNPADKKLWEFTIPADKLGPRANNFIFSAQDAGNNKLLKDREPSSYPYRTTNWTSDTTGLTGTDPSYFLYVKPSKNNVSGVQVFVEKSCVAGSKIRAIFVNNTADNYYIDFGDGTYNADFKANSAIDHYYTQNKTYKAKLKQNYPANDKVTETRNVKL